MFGQPSSAATEGQARSTIADISLQGTTRTRHSIWLGESRGKSVHIYWELAERELNDRRAPVYIAADGAEIGEEMVIRLPKEIAMRLPMVLSSSWTEDVARAL